MITDQVSLDTLSLYYYSGNIPDITYNTAVPIGVTITLQRAVGGEVFSISEIHAPVDGKVIIRIRELIHNELSSHFDFVTPFGGTDEYETQSAAIGRVNIDIPGDIDVCPTCLHDGYYDPCPTCGTDKVEEDQVHFFVAKGNMDLRPGQSFNFLDYFMKNFMTLSPQRRKSRFNDPCVVGFLACEGITVKIESNMHKGGTSYFNVGASVTYGMGFYCMDATFSRLRDFLEAEHGSVNINDVTHITIWADGDTESLHPLQIIKDDSHYDYNDIFLFESALGGIDTIRFTGVLSSKAEHEYLSANILRRQKEYGLIPLTVKEKNTGVIPDDEHLRWVMDFFASSTRYHWKNGKWWRIYILDKEAQVIKGRINSFTFKFAYEYQHTGIQVDREAEL